MNKVMFKANPGCGKTYQVIQEAIRLSRAGEKGIVISFNRNVREKIMATSPNLQHSTFTFHAIAYQDCIRPGFIRDIDLNEKDDKVYSLLKKHHGAAAVEKIKKHPYMIKEYIGDIDGELTEFGKEILRRLPQIWLLNADRSRFTGLQFIIVDEVQDLDNDLLNMLFILAELSQGTLSNLILAGDEKQDIYAEMGNRKTGSTFRSLRKQFGEFEVIQLRDSYRLSPALQRFANRFSTAHHHDSVTYDLSKYPESSFTEDVFVHAMQNWGAVIDEVRSLVTNYSGKRILILSHTHHQLDQLNAEFKDDANIRVSTIHAAKGGESDIVIIANSMFGDKMSEMTRNVWYVAITRAAQTLHIVSSFPLTYLAEKFGKPGAYTLINKQAKVSSSRMKPLDETIHTLTFDQACRSMIDSVDIRIPYTACPFVPYEANDAKPKKDENGQKIKRSEYAKETIKEFRGLKFAITRHNGKYLTFEFHDLNLLKARGMNDNELMTVLNDIIKEYFAYQISDETISALVITRLDLCRLVRTADTSILDIFSLVYRFSRYVDAKEKTKVKPGENESRTVYLNACRSKNRPIRTLRAYAPTDKAINAINDSNCVIKLEVEKHRSEGTGDCHLDMRMNELLSFARRKALPELYASWLRYEFPLLSDPNQNQGRRHFSSQDEIMSEVSVAKKSRDKRPLFYAFLNQLPEDIANPVRTLFCIRSPSNESPAQDRASSFTSVSDGLPDNRTKQVRISTDRDMSRKKETGKKPRGKGLKRNAPKGVYINAPKSKARPTSGRQPADRTVSSGLTTLVAPKSRSISEKR